MFYIYFFGSVLIFIISLIYGTFNKSLKPSGLISGVVICLFVVLLWYLMTVL